MQGNIRIEVYQLQLKARAYINLHKNKIYDPNAVSFNKIGIVTSKYSLNDPEIIWDLCNYSCWGWNNDNGKDSKIAKYTETDKKKAPTKAVIKDNYKFTFTNYNTGVANDDICFSLDNIIYISRLFGWDKINTTLKDAERLLKEGTSLAAMYLKDAKAYGLK